MKENNNVWRVFSVGMTILSVMVGADHFNHGRWAWAVLFVVFAYSWMGEVKR